MSDQILVATERLVGEESRGAVLTVVAGEGAGEKAVLDARGGLIIGEISAVQPEILAADLGQLLDRELSITLAYDAAEVFFEVLVPRPILFVFGAVHIAQELVRHGSLLGFRTIVADPRAAFLTEERFPESDEMRVGWPDAVCDSASLDDRTFVVVLTHDRRFEDPLWPIALASEARYIGAMGSRKTTAARANRLLEAGFSEADVARIHGPVGLEIGSRTAGETAIAILAEIISVRYRSDEALSLIGRPQRT